MSDDDKKDPKLPDHEELRKSLEGIFGKMDKTGFSFPGMSPMGGTQENEFAESPEEEDAAGIFEFDYLPRLYLGL